MKKIRNILVLSLMATVIATGASAQNKKPRVSPPETAKGMIKKATITIHYSSPSVKDRKIWGGLVPYDSVWRAGANEATTFETTKDIKVQGKWLPAGKYAFFLIPKENEQWIAVFNNVPTQWGAFKYDQSKDQLRVSVKPKKAEMKQEMLVYHITSGGFLLDWENLAIPVSVK